MEALRTIINEVLDGEGFPQIESLKRSLNLRDDLQMDSLMLAELTVRIELEYGVDIFEDGLIHTVGDIISKVERN